MNEYEIRRIVRIVIDELKVPLAEEVARVILNTKIEYIEAGTFGCKLGE